MKINWHPNPFYTKVEIDDRDRERVLLYLQNEEYVEILCGLDNALNGKYRGPALTDLEEIKKEVGKWGDICNMTINSEEVTTFLSYIDTVHLGDCTCVPCSCIRCQVEEALGVDTIKGLGKHSARKIEGAFGRDEVSGCSINCSKVGGRCCCKVCVSSSNSCSRCSIKSSLTSYGKRSNCGGS